MKSKKQDQFQWRFLANKLRMGKPEIKQQYQATRAALHAHSKIGLVDSVLALTHMLYQDRDIQNNLLEQIRELEEQIEQLKKGQTNE